MKGIIAFLRVTSFTLLASLSAGQSYLTKLAPSNLSADDNFGYSIGISGNIIVVGAPFYDSGGISNSGTAYVFQRSLNTWAQTGRIFPSDPVQDGNFGYSIAIDWQTIVVGAPGSHILGQPNGAAYVFEKIAGTWSLKSKLSANDAFQDGRIDDRFGTSVDIFGEAIAIGSPLDDTVIYLSTGSAYIYKKISGVWTEQQKLLGSQAWAGDLMGVSISILDDIVAIGAPTVLDDTRALDRGMVYIFNRVGSTWIEEDLLFPPGLGNWEFFGISVDLQPTTIAIGASNSEPYGPESGKAFVFENFLGNWILTHELWGTYGANGDKFGHSIGLSDNKLIVGSYLHDGAGQDSGLICLYGKNGPYWLHLGSLLPPSSTVEDWTSYSLMMNDTFLVAGAPMNDSVVPNGGAVHIWTLQPFPEYLAFCFGESCPCGNNDTTAGCANSSGEGALLAAQGSLSMTESSLELLIDTVAPNEFVAIIFGYMQTPVFAGDGNLCIASGSRLQLLQPPGISDGIGDFASDIGVFDSVPGIIPGVTYYFQAIYRDRNTPCGGFLNLSNALALTAIP